MAVAFVEATSAKPSPCNTKEGVEGRHLGPVTSAAVTAVCNLMVMAVALRLACRVGAHAGCLCTPRAYQLLITGTR